MDNEQGAVDLRTHFHLPAVGMPRFRRGGQWPDYGQEDSETEEAPEEGDASEMDEEKGSGTDYERRLAVAESKVKAANREAKNHRLKAKEYARQLREAKGGDDGFETKQALEERDALRVENAVLKAAMTHGVDPDLLELKLHKAGHLKLDEEGDLPVEFDEAAEEIAKRMISQGREAGPRAPKSPTLSGTSRASGSADLESLKRRYPALTRRG